MVGKLGTWMGVRGALQTQVGEDLSQQVKPNGQLETKSGSMSMYLRHVLQQWEFQL